MPEWSTAEWASVIATAFAALAATASWIAILFDRRAQREARRPTVSASFLTSRSGVGKIAFANGGPGLAVAVCYYGVHRETASTFSYGGYVGNGFLQPGDEQEVAVGLLNSYDGTATFVWICRDVDNNVYIWSYDQKHERISAKKSSGRPKLVDDFRRMYPDVGIPEA